MVLLLTLLIGCVYAVMSSMLSTRISEVVELKETASQQTKLYIFSVTAAMGFLFIAPISIIVERNFLSVGKADAQAALGCYYEVIETLEDRPKGEFCIYFDFLHLAYKIEGIAYDVDGEIKATWKGIVADEVPRDGEIKWAGTGRIYARDHETRVRNYGFITFQHASNGAFTLRGNFIDVLDGPREHHRFYAYKKPSDRSDEQLNLA